MKTETHINMNDLDDLVQDLCRTRNCPREPVRGALYCNDCYDAIEAEQEEEER